ncbi:hypothetical protein RHMOL_Rhmol12G0222000 [Rhododendron molle]|uniref:Uncharacterized protein n=1 Tax=Rhododendron molle TaxID=49168 RepID=A0ACC0LML4_RHOML|nr:hypothetical protein RHMOL_Rhmol12G0222000 [Rhododendron molle]
MLKLTDGFQANNVDFYMSGHDHCLERISCHNSRIQFLTSGAGSKAWRGDEKLRNDCTVHFFYDGQGFMSVQLSSTNAQMRSTMLTGRRCISGMSQGSFTFTQRCDFRFDTSMNIL